MIGYEVWKWETQTTLQTLFVIAALDVNQLSWSPFLLLLLMRFNIYLTLREVDKYYCNDAWNTSTLVEALYLFDAMLTQLYITKANSLEALDPPYDISLSIEIDYIYYIDVWKARIVHQWPIP